MQKFNLENLIDQDIIGKKKKENYKPFKKGEGHINQNL